MGEKKRILIIDDDPEIRDLLEFDIASSGYFVDTAKDGMEGLNKALNNIRQYNFLHFEYIYLFFIYIISPSKKHI